MGGQIKQYPLVCDDPCQIVVVISQMRFACELNIDILFDRINLIIFIVN